MLGVAARHADTVGLLPVPIKNSEDRDDPLDLLPAALEQKIAVLRAKAGDRFPCWNSALSSRSGLPAEGRLTPRRLSQGVAGGGISVGTVWEMPTILIGSAAQIREDMQAQREQFGLSYLITSDRVLPALTEIIASL